MTRTKYIGMDVHKESVSIAVRNDAGKIVMECVIETKASMILQFFDGLRGDVHVTFEEGTWAAWLYDLLKPHVTKVLVCDPRRNALLQEGNQNDRVDARKLAELLHNNQLAFGLSRRPRPANLEGIGAQLSDHHPGSQPGYDPGEGHLSQLGHPMYRQAGLRTEPSCRVARENQRTRSAPASGILLSATRRATMPAAASAAGSAGGE